jgi:predicted nucleotidyltransferase
MQIDPKATVVGWPPLVVRDTFRKLRTTLTWGLGELQSAASVQMHLPAQNSIERGHSNSTAEGITRATAENALEQFLDRVEQVNNDPYFLGRVTKVVLVGRMLKPEVERLSDVDLAVELASKKKDFDSARVRNSSASKNSPDRNIVFGISSSRKVTGIGRLSDS